MKSSTKDDGASLKDREDNISMNTLGANGLVITNQDKFFSLPTNYEEVDAGKWPTL